MMDRYQKGLADGWEDCRKAVRDILASEVSDAEKLELIARQADPAAFFTGKVAAK